MLDPTMNDGIVGHHLRVGLSPRASPQRRCARSGGIRGCNGAAEKVV